MLMHFLKLMVTRRWGWVLIGLLIFLAGLLWGVYWTTALHIDAGANNTNIIINDATVNGGVNITGNSTFFYESRWWPMVVALIGAGLLITSVALFVRHRRRNSASPSTSN